MTPKALATAIVKRIHADGSKTWEELQARSDDMGIDRHLFLDAMQLVNVHRDIHARELKGGMTYSKREHKEYTPRYATEPPIPYPQPPCWDCNTPMRAGQTCIQCKKCHLDHPIFDGMDYSYLFLTPKEHLARHGVRHGCVRGAGGRIIRK